MSINEMAILGIFFLCGVNYKSVVAEWFKKLPKAPKT